MNMPAADRPSPTHDAVLARLLAVGQEHVLAFYPELSAAHRNALLHQAASLDLESLPSLVQKYVLCKPVFELPQEIQPAPYHPGHGTGKGGAARPEGDARRLGEELLNRGCVAAFVVAGGQGSRLGYEGPKGCYPAGAVTRKPLFHMFADQLLAAEARYGHAIPWYVMTSPLNHAATLRFFEQEMYFGLSRSNVMFFTQGTLPSLDIRTGKMLMTSKHEIATNPDGHGGSLRALWQSGAIDDMKRRGIEHISYFQVDNPIVRVIDPLFIGLHAQTEGAWEGRARSSGEMSSKMIPKVSWDEKVGVFCAVDGRVQVMEYSDLPHDLQKQTLADGRLRFIAGSIAVHAISVSFAENLQSRSDLALPYHRADKKVLHVDPDSGERVDPTKPNAVKLERFVFDALPMCEASIVYETDRIQEFAPIKNASGVDSVESSRQIQTKRAALWLAAHGVTIPRDAAGEPDCTLEISAMTAMEPEDLHGKRLPTSIPRSGKLAM